MIMCPSGATCLTLDWLVQNHDNVIMYLSGATCLTLDWLVQNHDNVSEWSDMFNSGLVGSES
jgi:hypothetical protein